MCRRVTIAYVIFCCKCYSTFVNFTATFENNQIHPPQSSLIKTLYKVKEYIYSIYTLSEGLPNLHSF